ncbi:MAG: hypothetical protein WCV93_00255 [Candidatus Shapirobacteria bacterium]
MTRTQIYLDQNLAASLRTGAKLNKITVSAYIRQLLNAKPRLDSGAKIKNTDPLILLARMAVRRPVSKRSINISENIDKYLPENLR